MDKLLQNRSVSSFSPYPITAGIAFIQRSVMLHEPKGYLEYDR